MRSGLRALGTAVEIEIWSDVVCPWCYIGKARLEQAIADYPGEVTVRWRAYQLDPGAASDGKPLTDWLTAKFGGPEQARKVLGHTAATAAADGLTLNFDAAIGANTFDAHRLVWFAAQHGKEAKLVEALHAAHFTDGEDIGSRPVLAAIAAAHGLDAAAFLDSDAGAAEVAEDLQEAAELGITSVPTFVIDGTYAVTGAQSVEVLSQVLAEVDRLAAAPA
jgi:predicted DsbA family dithiol-disulfide isomerase